MIAVSNNWKNLFSNTILPEGFVDITYNLTDNNLSEISTVSGLGTSWVLSNLQEVVDASIVQERRYATFERNAWVLNGSSEIAPVSNVTGSGYVSTTWANYDATYGTNPKVTTTLSETPSKPIMGVTVSFASEYREYAVDFTISFFNASSVKIKEIVVTGNAEYTRMFYVSGLETVRSVSVEVSRWNIPFRLVKVMEVFLGLRRTYTKKDLTSFEHNSSADVLAGELPQNSITFRVDNSGNPPLWNPDLPESFEAELLIKKPLRVRYGFKINNNIEWIRSGVFYMSEWDTPANGLEASFTARDLIEFCNVEYIGMKSGSLTTIAQTALEQIGIKTGQYSLELKAINVDFSADEARYTVAEVLQMIASSSNCVIHQDGRGVLNIKPLNEIDYGYVIEKMNCYSHPEFELTKSLKQVNINDSMSIYPTILPDEGEVLTLNNPLINGTNGIEVAKHCYELLVGRKKIKANFRIDPRLEVLDRVSIVSRFSTNDIYVTDVKIKFDGSFKGTIEGRVISNG